MDVIEVLPHLIYSIRRGFAALGSWISLEAMLGSGRFLTSEDEEISLLPKTRWEELVLTESCGHGAGI